MFINGFQIHNDNLALKNFMKVLFQKTYLNRAVMVEKINFSYFCRNRHLLPKQIFFFIYQILTNNNNHILCFRNEPY